MPAQRVILMHPNDGCLTLARVLTRRGIRVSALATPAYRYVLSSRGVTGRVMPDIRRHADAWIAELRALANGPPAAVVCGSDAATEFVTQHRATLPASLVTFEDEAGLHLRLMNKLELHRIAAAAGVRVPWMRLLRTLEDLDAVMGELPYPCVLKPTMGHVGKDLVGVGTAVVGDRSELVERARPLLDGDVPILLTQLIPGPESSLEGAVAVRDRSGRYVLEYGRRKVRQWPPDYGVGSLVESAHVPETLAMNRRLLDYTGYFGIAATETKRHAETGELYLIETNVRVPGTFGLSEACGVDGSWRLFAALAGLEVQQQSDQIDGRKVMLPQKEIRAAWAQIRARDTTLRGVLTTWRGSRDLGAIALRDPGPAVALVVQLARKAPTRRRSTVPARWR